MKPTSFYIRAASFGVALFVSVGPADAVNTQEAVTKAQNMLLNKERGQALKFLLEVRSNPTLKAAEKAELNEAVDDVANRFITDKGQKLFELGLSELPAQATGALNNLKKAQTLEGGNLQIESAITRAQIFLDDCRAARRTLTTWPGEGQVGTVEFQELQLVSAWCLEDNEAVELLTKPKTGESRLSPALIKAAHAWLKWRNQELDRAANLLRESWASEPQNPAIMYWYWRTQKDQEQDAQSVAKAFVKRCRGREAEVRRRKFSMAEYCLKLSEVENYLRARGAEANEGT